MKPLTEKDKIFLKEGDKVCIPYFELQRQLDEARVLGSVQGWNSALDEFIYNLEKEGIAKFYSREKIIKVYKELKVKK